MRPILQIARIIACTLGRHRGNWHRTHWNRIEARYCRHCGQASFRPTRYYL